MRHHAVLLISMLIVSLCSLAQDSSTVSVKYINGIAEKSSKLDKKIARQTAKCYGNYKSRNKKYSKNYSELIVAKQPQYSTTTKKK